MSPRTVSTKRRGVIGLIAFVLVATSGLLANLSANIDCGPTTLNPDHVDASSVTFTHSCDGSEPIDGTEVFWHFVLTSTTDPKTKTLMATFETAGDQVGTFIKQSGGVLHWYIITPTNDVLLSASTDACGNNLNLSHVCGGGGGGSEPAIARITTEVHLGATDNGTPIVVDNCNGANAGATVHDSAQVTTTPAGVVMPDGSSITFLFFNNNSCQEPPLAVSDPIDVSGEINPSVDPALVQGPLGPGGYSYKAIFTSGNTEVVRNAVGECEPFTVYNAPLTPGYWKNHLTFDRRHPDAPYTEKCLSVALGNYVVDSTAKATAVWNNMNCSSSSDNDALGCLAGHLLAAELNVCNGSAPCIGATIDAANSFLADRGYSGPGGTYVLTAAQRALAISLKNALDKYNNGGGCPPGSVCP